MKKILLFQVEQPMNVKLALATMHLRVEAIPNEQFGQKIDNLVSGMIEEVELFSGDKPEGSLLLMCDLTSSEIDQVLYRLRNKKINITYKAILTAANRNWTVPELFVEMEKEKKAMEAKYKLIN